MIGGMTEKDSRERLANTPGLHVICFLRAFKFSLNVKCPSTFDQIRIRYSSHIAYTPPCRPLAYRDCSLRWAAFMITIHAIGICHMIIAQISWRLRQRNNDFSAYVYNLCYLPR